MLPWELLWFKYAQIKPNAIPISQTHWYTERCKNVSFLQPRGCVWQAKRNSVLQPFKKLPNHQHRCRCHLFYEVYCISITRIYRYGPRSQLFWQKTVNSCGQCSRKFHRGLMHHAAQQLIHAELHWLDIPERVKYYKLGMITVITRRCLNGYCSSVPSIHSIIKTLNHSWQTATEYTWFITVIIVNQSNVNL